MQFPKWYYFYDFHTMPKCPGVGAEFDIPKFADHLKNTGVEYLVFHARCNLGMAYYQTKVGIPHPSMQRDLLKELISACHSRGIKLTAYLNAGLSHEEGLHHRDWLEVAPDGVMYKQDRMDNFFRRMCYNTGYGNHLLTMIRELVTNYRIDGLFIDCMKVGPCIGVECVREMKQRGLNWNDPKAQKQFARESTVRMARRIAETARSVRDDLMLYFNGVQFEDQLEFCTHLEIECLPTSIYGATYETLPIAGQYARTLGKTVYNMTGRFHDGWADFGGIRTDASLEYDLLQGMAYGLWPCVGDHLHPTGKLNAPVERMKARVFRRLQALTEWVDGATSGADIAVVAPKGQWKHDPIMETAWDTSHISGVVRALGEMRAQFDIISEYSQKRDYAVMVLPDVVLLNAEWKDRIRKHLDAGGKVLSTGWSGLDPDKKEFALAEWGLRYDGDDPHDPAYFEAGPRVSNGVPDMPLNFYSKGAAVTPLGGTEVLAHIVAPFFNQEWDGEHGNYYCPPDKKTGRPAATLHGSVAHISHAVFESYYRHASPPVRQLVANLLKILHPKPVVKTEGLPSFARVIATHQPNRKMAHILSYVPERRGKEKNVIEEPIEIRDIKIGFRLDKGETPKRAYLAPTRDSVDLKISDGYAWAKIPSVSGYALLVLE